MERHRRLLDDTRGANLIEYLIIAGLVALVAVAGVRRFGDAALSKAEQQASCVASFSCGGTADGTASTEATGDAALAIHASDGAVRAAEAAASESAEASPGFASWAAGEVLATLDSLWPGDTAQALRGTGEREALIDGLMAAQQAEGLTPDHDAAEAIATSLLAGDTSDAARDQLAAFFLPLGVEASHLAMETIRDEGHLDTFMSTVLRDADGNAVDARLTDAMTFMMATGRLDVYAETLANTPISLYDPAAPEFAFVGGAHFFTPGSPDLPRGVYFNQDAIAAMFGTFAPGSADYTAAMEEIAGTSAHEVYHAYNDEHGGPPGAVNEGMGIAAIWYAYLDTDYDIAEAIYGTKNFYRDSGYNDPNYPLTAGTGDAELTAFMTELATRDNSGVAYDDQTRLDQEYQDFYEDIDRTDYWAWIGPAQDARLDMIAARYSNGRGMQFTWR